MENYVLIPLLPQKEDAEKLLRHPLFVKVTNYLE